MTSLVYTQVFIQWLAFITHPRALAEYIVRLRFMGLCVFVGGVWGRWCGRGYFLVMPDERSEIRR